MAGIKPMLWTHLIQLSVMLRSLLVLVLSAGIGIIPCNILGTISIIHVTSL
jgi:hypothetical protein